MCRRLLSALLWIPLLAAEDEWSRFRGQNGTGVSADKGLPAEIGKDRSVKWKVPVLKGNSSPIVVKGRVWLTGHEGDERVLLCLDATTGKEVWRKGVPKARTEVTNPLNGPATPTPTTDGKSIFVFFPEVGLLAYDFDGKERWRVPLGPFGAIQGMAVSPVYAEGSVFLLVDTPEEAYLAAYDAGSGKAVWKAPRPVGFLGSYATPSVHRPTKGPAQIVVAGAVELTGYHAKTGERLWWVNGVTNGPASLPLVAGDAVFTMEPVDAPAPPFDAMLKQFDKNSSGTIELSELSGGGVNETIMSRIFKSIDKNSGNGDGSTTGQEWDGAFPSDPPGGLVRTRLGGQGDVTATHVGWRHKKGLSYTTAPLLYEGVLYVIRNGGILSTFNPETGQVLREERLKDALGEYYAQPVAGDGKVYFINRDGKVTVIRAGGTWEILSSANLDETVIATPAIAGGRIFVRTEKTIYCFGS